MIVDILEKMAWNSYSLEGVRSIQLTPLELISRLSALIPDPRCHQHHYYGVFATNALLWKKLVHHANKAIDEHVPILGTF